MAKKRTELEIRSKGGNKVERDLKKISAAGDEAGRKIKRGGAQASSGLKAIDAASARARNSVRGLSERLGPLGVGLSKLGPGGLAAAAGVAALTLGISKAVSAAEEAERAQFKIAALLETTGSASGQTIESIDRIARSIGEMTLASTNGVRDAAAALLTFKSVSGDAFERTLRLGQDVAAVMGTDIKSASIQLAKALEDPERNLSQLNRAGISFTQTQIDVIKSLVESGEKSKALSEILTIIEGQIGGAGQGEAAGLAGRFDTLGERIKIFAENVGNSTGALSLFTKTFDLMAKGMKVINDSFFPDIDAQLTSQFDKLLQVNQRIQAGGLSPRDLRAAKAEKARVEAELSRLTAMRQAQADQAVAAREAAAAAEKRQAQERKAAEAAAQAEKAEKARLAERKRALADIAKLEERASKAGLTGVALLEKERDEELVRQQQRLEAGIIQEEEFARARLAIEKDFSAQRAEIQRKEQEKLNAERRKAAEQAAEELQRPIRNAAENVQREFGNVFTSIFRNGKADSETFFNSMRNLAARTAGEIAAMLVFRPQLLAAGGGLGAIFSSGAAAASGGGGFSGIPGLGLFSGVGKSGFINVPGLGPLGTQSLALAAQALGAGFVGNRVGEYATGALGIKRNDGGTAGSVVGGTAGFILGGPIGAGIGAFLGDVVGNAIGDALGFGKSKVKVQIGTAVDSATARRAGFNNSRETPFGVVGLTSRSNNFGGGLGKGITNLLAGIDKGVASLLNQSQIEQVRAGLTKGGVGVTRRISAKKFDNEIFSVAKDRLVTIIDSLANNQVASKLLDGIQAKESNVKPLIDKAGEIIELIKMFDEPGEPVNEAQKAINALNDQFDQLAQAAQKLGFSVADAERKRADALKALTDDFDKTIRDQILAIEDPIKLALENQEKVAKERLDNARSLGADLVEVERLNALERQKILEQQVGSFTQANSSITAFLDSINISAAGGLTVADRAANADARFNDLISAARTDPGARSDLAGFLPTFVDLKRQQLGSTEAFFEFKSFLETSLRNLVSSQDTVSTLNDIGHAITVGNNAIVSELQGMAEDMRGLRAENAELRSSLSLLLNA